MNGLSLFSGIGGMDLAFEAAGGKVIAMVEIDSYCQKVLRKPDIPRVARGVKDRINRLKALGNACVPLQVYPIFKAIMDITEAD